MPTVYAARAVCVDVTGASSAFLLLSAQLKAPVIAKILIKALMNLPSTDFLTCTYLVPERVLDEAPVKDVCAVANLLLYR